ncbi:MAG: hypothetical protein Kow0077_32490 [Anaerolineae bacterium]
MRKVIVVGMVIAAVLALGVTAVYAQGPGGKGGFPGGRGANPGIEHTIIAEALGLEPDALQEALQSGQTVAEIAEAQGVALEDVLVAVTADAAERLTAAVEAGTMTQEIADARLALLEAELDYRFTTAPLARAAANPLTTIAEALGMEATDLQAALQEGQTVAEIAEAQGVALEDVIAAVTADAAERLAAAVEAGQLTQAQADAQLALLAANLEAGFNGQMPAFGPGFAPRDGRFDGRGGFGPGMMGRGMPGRGMRGGFAPGQNFGPMQGFGPMHGGQMPGFGQAPGFGG